MQSSRTEMLSLILERDLSSNDNSTTLTKCSNISLQRDKLVPNKHNSKNTKSKKDLSQNIECSIFCWPKIN